MPQAPLRLLFPLSLVLVPQILMALSHFFLLRRHFIRVAFPSLLCVCTQTLSYPLCTSYLFSSIARIRSWILTCLVCLPQLVTSKRAGILTCSQLHHQNLKKCLPLGKHSVRPWLGGSVGWSIASYTKRLQVQSPPSQGTYMRQLITISLSHGFLTLSFSLPPPL